MKKKYMCLKTYEDEKDNYGIDFYCGKIYEYEDEYMHSTENGTNVWIPKEELKRYWQRVVC